MEGIHEEDVGLAMDVRNAFFILSEERQMIVGLSVFGGYNSTEIGKILSLKPGTVRVKRSRALEKMQCVLDGRTFMNKNEQDMIRKNKGKVRTGSVPALEPRQIEAKLAGKEEKSVDSGENRLDWQQHAWC